MILYVVVVVVSDAAHSLDEIFLYGMNVRTAFVLVPAASTLAVAFLGWAALPATQLFAVRLKMSEMHVPAKPKDAKNVRAPSCAPLV